MILRGTLTVAKVTIFEQMHSLSETRHKVSAKDSVRDIHAKMESHGDQLEVRQVT
jgi:hypothetical protein